MAGKVTEDDSCFFAAGSKLWNRSVGKDELELESKESVHLSPGCMVSSIFLSGPSFSLLFHTGDLRALLIFPVPEFQTMRLL